MPLRAVCATMLGVVGVYSVWSTVLYLWDLWRTDPLKSIGGFVPLVSLVLILRVWRASDWETQGSWWGVAVLTATVAAVHWRDAAVLELVLSASWTIFLPPHSLVAFAYGSGVVLLFGGTRLYRAALFPLAFLFLVNPVPHAFNRFVDLPLQQASAATARGFAHALGQRLTPSELYLLFTPSFGMFIAPGCNGIRGSVTMGLIALVAGYLYQFRLRVWAATVAVAVLLGYLFNLVRLCALVVYYVVALHLPWLQSRAEMGDYVIGAGLFFLATLLLFEAVGRFSSGGDLLPPPVRLPVAEATHAREVATGGRQFWLRWVAFLALCALGSLPYAHGLGRVISEPPDQAIFPAAQGPYALRRTWQEKLPGGPTIFDWAEYARPGSATAVAVGVSPVLGAHDTLLCHTARGEDWVWHGQLALPTAAGPVSFSSSLYNNGTAASLEASTVCSGERCGQWTSARRHLGLVYSRPDAASVLGTHPERPIPVLLKVEIGEATLPLEQARAALGAQLGDFLVNTALGGLTRPYRVR